MNGRSILCPLRIVVSETVTADTADDIGKFKQIK